MAYLHFEHISKDQSSRKYYSTRREHESKNNQNIDGELK